MNFQRIARLCALDINRARHRMRAWAALFNSIRDDLERLWNLVLLRSRQSQALESAGNHRFHSHGIAGRNTQYWREFRVVISPVNILWLQLQIMSFRLSTA